MDRRSPYCKPRQRRGYLLPAIALALLVVGAALALVLDRLWIDAARSELTAAAQAAALAAAQRLADDERLRLDADPVPLADAARAHAARVAAENLVAGEPLQLDARAGGDVRLGQIVIDDAGREVFLETDLDATSVVVFAERSRGKGNPVALFLRELARQSIADVGVSAEASVDHGVIGVRPLDGAAAPALPLAILAADRDGVRTDTWLHQIEQRQGADLYGIDSETGRVTPEPDGLPELTLGSATLRGDSADATRFNMRLVDVGAGLSTGLLVEQVQNGWIADDLASRGGALTLGASPLVLPAMPVVPGRVLDVLPSVIGQRRIALLYTESGEPHRRGVGQVAVLRFVALRMMDVSPAADGAVRIVVQPTVIATRTAVLASSDDAAPAINPYLCKLHLTQ